ncbi:MAG: hypothetical protein JXJ17_13925 [Anaerolineae bacterium]|nr:hypothetical protein [Anaerolineae bacterium]
MMRRKILQVTLLVAAVGLALASLAATYTAVRRVHRPYRQAGGAVAVEGVITEKLVEQRTDRFLPFEVTTYIIRYAFPNTQGKMRTGEQDVTRRFYDRTGGQGTPITVTIAAGDSAISAVDPYGTFPGIAGWRLSMGLTGFVIAVALAVAANRFSSKKTTARSAP